MKNCTSVKVGLLIGTIFLLISSIVAPMTIGYNVRIPDKATIVENYDCYHVSEIPNFIKHRISKASNIYDNIESEKISKSEKTLQPLYGSPIDSPWPMYCHDVRHTGRSPYSTVDTWEEIWKFETYGWAEGGPTINKDGTIYVGAYSLYAVYPNGTLKWEFNTIFSIVSAPAIDDNGIIYFGIIYGEPNYLYAVYPNGTLKWKFPTGHIFSSPAIDDDGTIYIGTSDDVYPTKGSVWAINPDGTQKWRFQTNHVIYSSPAIGLDGTIYCGCHDTYLYALYPNNGTLKWKYKTGDWIRVSPCIADDGTIYVVSLDSYLYALYPNGTLKWKTDVGAGTSPTIGQDGTIYAGYTKLHAINPANGSVKWTFKVGGTMEGGTPCNSIDGTIYVGTGDNGQIVAINHNGTERWRKKIGKYIDSPPAIGEDGTVYIGSSQAPGEGYLYAFGVGELEANANGPYYGLINQPVKFEGYSKGGYSPYSYLWYFGDGNIEDEEDPTHIYSEPGNYTVVFTVTDNTSNTSSDTSWALIQETNEPPDNPTIDGPESGRVGTSIIYSASTTDPDENQLLYWFDWGDGTSSGWVGPYDSGDTAHESHIWVAEGNYFLKVKAKDIHDAESGWSEYLSVTIPRNRATTSLFNWFLEMFPLLSRLLNIR
jgi:outer membrane protein assembly factor BamB